MKNRWQQLKFIWEYATHFQTDNAPPLDIIFKFVNDFRVALYKLLFKFSNNLFLILF